jgi:hypothetical protein
MTGHVLHGSEDRCMRVCDATLKLPHQQHAVRRQWLIETRSRSGTNRHDDLPNTKGLCMPKGAPTQKKTGQAWRQLAKPAAVREAVFDAPNERLVVTAVRGIHEAPTD